MKFFTRRRVESFSRVLYGYSDFSCETQLFLSLIICKTNKDHLTIHSQTNAIKINTVSEVCADHKHSFYIVLYDSDIMSTESIT